MAEAKKEADKQVMVPASAGALAEMGLSVDELTKDANLGGTVGMQDIAIPYLYCLQSNSPQAIEDHAKYIVGAKSSMLYLTVLEKIFEGREKGILVVPCHYERLITEWVDRDAGGGLVRSYPAGDPIMDRAKPDAKGRPVLPNGHLLIDTAYHYLLINEPGTQIWHQGICPMKSTHLKRSRRWNSEINTTKIPGTDSKAPRFLYMYRFRTEKEQKDDNVYNVPVITKEGLVAADVYHNAKALSKIAAESTLRNAAAESAQQGAEDEVPF